MKQATTIMQILPSLKQGGVETGTIEIARALQKAGIPNIVVSNGGPMVATLKKLGIKHYALHTHSKNPIMMWWNAKQIAQIATENNVTLMHVRSRAPAWSVKWASRQTGIPFITSYHGIYATHPAIKKWYNRIMLTGQCVIAVSEYVKQHLITEYQYPAHKIHVIHRGADLKRFNPDKITPDQIGQICRQYRIPMDKPIITLVGRLSKMKGQTLLLQALTQMQHQEVTCLLVGGKTKKDYESDIKSLVNTLPDTMTVRTLSVPAKDMPIIYSISHVVVSASVIPETFGRTMAEAGAMNRIVVAFNHGGPQEIIQHNKTGYLIPVGNIPHLAKTLDEVLDMKKSARQTMEQNARQRIEKSFSIQTMCDKTLRLYQEVLRGQKK